MAKLINAKCPNCGAILELPENLDRAFCMHCGGKVIIAKDVHYHGGKTAIGCPECQGRGYNYCDGEPKVVRPPFKYKFFDMKYLFRIYPCYGSGKCEVASRSDMGEYTIWPRIDVVKDPNEHGWCEDGKCSTCHGTGIQKGPLGSSHECWVCKETKICFICKGTGKCTFCGGTGKEKCEPCNGTGFKVYEGG